MQGIPGSKGIPGAPGDPGEMGMKGNQVTHDDNGAYSTNYVLIILCRVSKVKTAHVVTKVKKELKAQWLDCQNSMRVS